MLSQTYQHSLFQVSTFTFSGDIKTDKLSDHVLASFTFTKTDAAAGAFTVSLTSTETASIPAGTHVYDISYVDSADNSRVRLLEGTATVSGEVTKA
jgi:hypothetical protein